MRETESCCAGGDLFGSCRNLRGRPRCRPHQLREERESHRDHESDPEILLETHAQFRHVFFRLMNVSATAAPQFTAEVPPLDCFSPSPCVLEMSFSADCCDKAPNEGDPRPLITLAWRCSRAVLSFNSGLTRLSFLHKASNWLRIVADADWRRLPLDRNGGFVEFPRRVLGAFSFALRCMDLLANQTINFAPRRMQPSTVRGRSEQL